MGTPTQRPFAAWTLALAALPLAGLLLAGWALSRPADLPMHLTLPWAPAAGVSLAFRIDGLSGLMLLMITGVGLAVFVYAHGYFGGAPASRRLYAWLLVFMTAMVGCVLADDLVVLFLFWELTSLASFMLIGFNHEDETARRGARQALLITGAGGLALLLGLILLGQLTGQHTLTGVIEVVPSLGPSPALTAAMGLIVVGAFTKSAQFPFHFWLPDAMAAPTPVSAYLHSATMVKLGVYLLARLDPAFGAMPLWETLLSSAGSITAAWGMLLAIRERDLKRILARSTVATLGVLMVLVSLSGPEAALAVALLMLAHALYKAPLFFVAGNVDHGVGTREIDRLGALATAMPWTAAAAVVASASMAGLPLSFGFVAKDIVTEAKSVAELGPLVTVSNLIFSAVAVAIAGVAALRVFFRHPGRLERPEAHEGGVWLTAPPLALGTISLLLGLFPHWIEGPLVAAAAAMTPDGATTAAMDALRTKAVPEWGPVLSSLGVSLAVGGAVYVFWDWLHDVSSHARPLLALISLRALFDRTLKAVPYLAARVTRAHQHGDLRGYVAIVAIVVAAVLGGILAAGYGTWPRPSLAIHQSGVFGPALALALSVVALGAFMTCVVRRRFLALLCAGLVGYGSAAAFLFTGAPDLAFTQFVVETVFVTVAAASLLHLSRRGRAQAHPAESKPRPFAALASVLVAGVLCGVMLLATAGVQDPTLERALGAESVPAAKGRNVVNVVIVDFRGLDTLAESAVLLFAFLAALPLLEALRRSRPAGREGTRPMTPRVSVILRAFAPCLYALTLATSLWVLVRGHNEPGGGFIGGLVAACASILWALVHGVDASSRRLPLRSAVRLGAVGVLLSVGSGLLQLAFGLPFLTHPWVTVPVLGGVKISSVMLFDLGVYLCVWGALAGYALGLLRVEEHS